MLSGSANFTSALNSQIRNFNVKVLATRNISGGNLGNNQPIDISDRITSYTTTHDFSSRAGRLNLTIDNYDYTYSPQNRTSSINLNGGVYDPIFDSDHRIEVFEGLLTNSGTYEYVKKFEGYIGDDVTASATSPEISLSIRDKSKLLQDKYIYQSPTYALWLVEQVIQDMLNTFANELGITLQVQTPTQYMIGRPDLPYTASDTNLWDAIQLLADTASQELRFMEDGTLLLRPVVRDWTNYPVNLYLNESTLTDDQTELSDADVRNYIVVKVQNFPEIIASDSSSMQKYGMRYMEVTRSVTDLITDASQAVDLANNILWDLKYARPNQTSEIPLHPLVQVGDIVKIQDSRLGTNYTDDLYKVLTVENDYQKDKKRTRLTLQGYDAFVSDKGIAPNPPTAFSFSSMTRIIQNYTNSGWKNPIAYEKHIFYPQLQWTPPATDVSGNALSGNFGGYIIERASKIVSPYHSGVIVGNSTGGTLGTNWNWTTIASIPSYIDALGSQVNYFFDYTSAKLLNDYANAGYTSGSVSLQYRITALTTRGAKSTVAGPISININFPQYFDISGNQL